MVKIACLIKPLKSLISDYAIQFPKSVASYPRLGRQSGTQKEKKCIFWFQPQVLNLKKSLLEIQLARHSWASYFSYCFNEEKNYYLSELLEELEKI